MNPNRLRSSTLLDDARLGEQPSEARPPSRRHGDHRATGTVRGRAGVDGPRDDRPRPHDRRHRRDRHDRHRRRAARSSPRAPTSSSTRPTRCSARMDPVVVEMHTRCGLLEAIGASTITLEEAGAPTLEFIQEHVPEPRTVPLCGNSIGTDRRFLAAYLPEIEDYLHYRSVDVSTIKELARRWYPRCARRGRRRRQPPRPRRHPRVDRRAALLPRARLRAPVVDRRRRADRAERDGDDAPCVLDGYGGPEVLSVADVDAAASRDRRPARRRPPRAAQPGRRPPADGPLPRPAPARAHVAGDPRPGVRRRRRRSRRAGHRMVGRRRGDGHRDRRLLRRAGRHPRPPGAAGARRARPRRRRRRPRGVHHRLGRARRAGRADERAVGARPRRRVRRRHGGDPDRQGDRGPRRRHVLGRARPTRAAARRRPRARALARRLAGRAAGRARRARAIDGVDVVLDVVGGDEVDRNLASCARRARSCRSG